MDGIIAGLLQDIRNELRRQSTMQEIMFQQMHGICQMLSTPSEEAKSGIARNELKMYLAMVAKLKDSEDGESNDSN